MIEIHLVYRYFLDYIYKNTTLIFIHYPFSFLCFQQYVDKDGHSYLATLEIRNVTVEDAGKYKVTAKNELGESNATISLNFDSKYPILSFI